MARIGDETQTNSKLEKQVQDLENLTKKLFEALEIAEAKLQKHLKDSDLYLLPQGTFYGKKYV